MKLLLLRPFLFLFLLIMKSNILLLFYLYFVVKSMIKVFDFSSCLCGKIYWFDMVKSFNYYY